MPELITRRSFGLSAGGWAIATRLFAAGEDAPWAGPAVVKRVFLAVPTPTWPRPDLDVAKEKAYMEATLADAGRRNAAAVRFTGGDLVRTPEDAQRFVAGLGDADGVLIVDLTSGTSGLLRPFADLSVPVLLYARPYSGWSFVDVVRWAQNGKRADLVVTSEPADLDQYLKMFRTIHHLRKSKVLVVASSGSRNGMTGEFTRQFGTSFDFPSYGDLKAAFDSADVKAAEKEAAEFTRAALKVVEPSAQEIADSMRLYHGILAILKREKANAITVDCLGGFKRGDLPAYPCLAWTKLNDQGLYGVCEADVQSTMTQLLLTSYTAKPGFVTDPVFDTGRSEIIHAHCVSATAMAGFDARRCPYAIRSHMEDNKGVSIQVMVPPKGTVTVGKFLTPALFGISTGEVLGNVDNPRGCRTKFRTKVADARKMLEGYTGGLHRVVVYGDYMKDVERMGRLMGFKVTKEC